MDRLQVRTTDVSWEQLDDEIIILDLASSNYLKLNGTGAALWHTLLAGTDRRALVEELCSRFGVDGSTAERDVEGFLDELRDAGLLEVAANR